MNTFQRVAALLAEVAGADDETGITIDTKPREFPGIDSLELVEFHMEIEDDFDVEIPDRVLAGFSTVGDIVAYLDEGDAA